MFKFIRDAKAETQVLNKRNDEYLSIFKSTKVIGKLQVDEENELFKVLGVLNPILRYDELIDYELVQDDEIVTSGGLGIGRAVVGGILAGGVGAVLGGLSKDRKMQKYVSDLHIEIKYRFNGKNQHVNLVFIKKRTKQKSSLYKSKLEKAESTLFMLDEIIKEDTKMESNVSPADELMKYKELLDMGAINQNEFDEVKAKLLSLNK